MPYAITLDANVLHPHIVADLILRLAERGMFRVTWSREILDEVERSLVRRGLDEHRVRRRIAMMETAFPEAMAPIAPLLPTIPEEIDAEDRHVVAAALAGKADGIVTQNLTHFPAEAMEALGLDLQTIDGFLLNQWTLDPTTVHDVLAQMEEDRDRPPKTVAELLEALERHAPTFVGAVQEAGAEGATP
jgi:predicted nucleic acid-binding protein